MKSSYMHKHGLALALTQVEMDEVNEKCGLVHFWAVKQTGPNEFMYEPAAEGDGVRVSVYAARATPHQIRTVHVPKTLRGGGREWGMSDVREAAIVRSGIKFTPDMSKPKQERERGSDAERIHRRAEKLAITGRWTEAEARDQGHLMSLREFTTAVDMVNKFVTENEGHVVLEVRNGMLKFLVEG